MTKKKAKTKADLQKELNELNKNFKKLSKENETNLDELEKLKADRDDVKDKWMRLAAEFDNAKKRMQKDKEEIIRYSNEKLVKELVEVSDNIDRTFNNINEEDLKDEKFKKFFDGLKMVGESFNNVLKDNGLEKFEPLNETFDPNLHDAMMTQVDNDKEENTIINVFKAGYKLNGRIIRHSQVIVSKKDNSEE